MWLREVSELLQKPTLVGTEIRPAFFPNALPSNMTLIQHDYTQPWPSYLHDQFDLVHQRHSLAAAVGVSIEHVVKQFPLLAKPGAWLQICEPDALGRDTDETAIKDYYKVVEVMKSMGGSMDASVRGTLASWLREVGMEDVDEIIVDLPLGRACDDAEIAEISSKWMTDTVKLIVAAVRQFGGSVPGVDINTLAQRFEKEVRESGAKLGIIIAIGRKPISQS